MRLNPLYIPIYGLILGLSEHERAGAEHARACAAYKADPSRENYRATVEAFKKTWPAMDLALIGLLITASELFAVVGLVFLVYSLVS